MGRRNDQLGRRGGGLGAGGARLQTSGSIVAGPAAPHSSMGGCQGVCVRGAGGSSAPTPCVVPLPFLQEMVLGLLTRGSPLLQARPPGPLKLDLPS